MSERTQEKLEETSKDESREAAGGEQSEETGPAG